jgi:hypothetical protein
MPSFLPSFLSLGATALGEPFPPQHLVSIALSFVFSIHSFIFMTFKLLQRHPSISNEVCNCIIFRKVQYQLPAQTLFLY